jgi:hypothetical protein
VERLQPQPSDDQQFTALQPGSTNGAGLERCITTGTPIWRANC